MIDALVALLAAFAAVIAALGYVRLVDWLTDRFHNF